MNYSLIILASAVLRFLVIHTAKRRFREGRHSREGGSLLCALERSKGKARTETIPQNVFSERIFWNVKTHGRASLHANGL